MALINCPECDGKISDSVKQCIHCGAKISACPECHDVFAKHLDSCPTCGYRFKETNGESVKSEQEKATKKETKKEELDDKDAKQIKDLWSSSKVYTKFYDNHIIKIILFSVAVLFLFIAIGKFVSWTNQLNKAPGSSLEDYEKAFNAYASIEDIKSDIKINIILSAILLASNAIYAGFGRSMGIFDFITWSNTRGVNRITAVKNMLAIDLSRIVPEAFMDYEDAALLIIDADIQSKDVTFKSNSLTYNTVRTILSIARNVFLLSFIYKNISNVMDKMFLSGPFKLWKFSNYSGVISDKWMLIAFAVCLVTSFVYSTVMEEKMQKTRDAWAKNNIPDYERQYKRYIKNADSYIASRM